MGLQKRVYSEKTLVNKLCSAAQKQSYMKKERFQGKKQRSMFLDKLSAYCDYEYNPEKKTYTVTKIYDIPKTTAQDRLHKGIYQFLAPLILNEIINHVGENYKVTLTVFNLAKKITMVNSNYDVLKFNMESLSNELEIPFYEMREYFNKTDLRIDEYLRRCINYLRNENCIIANEIYLIQTYDEDIELENHTRGKIAVITRKKEKHKASDEEIKLYANLVKEASRRSEAYTNYEQWYGKNAKRFTRELKRLFKEHNIEHICKAFEMWCVDLDKCKRMLDEYIQNFSLDKYKKMLGEKFKQSIDKNAKNRAEKKSLLDTDYIEHFKELSSLTILQDSDDIRKKLKSWKSKPERLLEKAHKINVEYHEIDTEKEE